MDDMTVLRRAYERENDTRDRRPPHLRNWEAYNVGATRKDMARLIDVGMVVVSSYSSKFTKYRLSEKGRDFVFSTLAQRDIVKIPAATVLEAMDLVVGFDDLKAAIALAVETRRRINFLLEGPPASIKGDVDVWVNVGNGPQSIPIASLEGRVFDALSIHPQSQRAGWYSAEVSSHEYEGDWIEITGVGVLPFTVTATHSLVDYDPVVGCLIPRRAGDIRPGDILPILSSWLTATTKEVLLNGVSQSLDAEFGFMLGFWLGDGGLLQGKTKAVTFSNYKTQALERIKHFLAKLPGYTNYNGGTLRAGSLFVQHQGLYQFLREHFLAGDGTPGVKGRTSRWKKLPGWVLAGPDDFIRELLNGYFFADGTVTNGVISATSTSPRLIRDMSMLLTRLGIVPGIQRRSHDAKGIVIRQCDAARFMEQVGTFRENRSVSTSVLLHDESFKVPFPFDSETATSLMTAIRKGSKSQSLTRRVATNLLANDWHQRLSTILNSHIRWVRVEKVRRWHEAKQLVYDLSVPKAETFVLGNRVIVHNCAKSLMLEGVRSAVTSAYIAFGSRTSAAGLSDALFEYQPSVLLLDEADKMDNECYSVMLGLMESGEVLETKSRKTRGVRLDTMVIAACNSSAKMPAEFLSRFALHAFFPKYTREEFIEVCTGFLTRAESCPAKLAAYLGQMIYDYGIGDVRKARGAWQLMVAPTQDEALRVIQLMLKYSPDGHARRKSPPQKARLL